MDIPGGIVMGAVLALFVFVLSIAVKQWLRHKRLKEFEDDVDLLISDYRSRLTGGNRFLISEDLLSAAFPEHSREDVREIWKRIVARKLVGRDELDSEMCIRK